MGISWPCYQCIHILKIVQKSFIPMKLSLLSWNSYHLSLHQYGATSAYLMSMKLWWNTTETGLSILTYWSGAVRSETWFLMPIPGRVLCLLSLFCKVATEQKKMTTLWRSLIKPTCMKWCAKCHTMNHIWKMCGYQRNTDTYVEQQSILPPPPR